jgi:hypothetical protein
MLDPRFVITDARLSRFEGSEVLRLRANLAGPPLVNGRVLYPFGSVGQAAGGFQITYTVAGTLQFDALLLISILAWPARSAREMGWRVAIAIPVGAMLLLPDVLITVVAELRNFLATATDPHGTSDWILMSRFLMGGGGLVIALIAAVLSIAAAKRLGDWQLGAPSPVRWRTVSRTEFYAFFRSYPRSLEVFPPFDLLARRHTIKDHSLGTGRDSWMAECRTGRRKSRYRIRADLTPAR